MEHSDVDRRSVLKSGAAIASLGLVGSLSGCSSNPLSGDGGNDSGANERINDVPQGSTFALHVDIAGMLSDDVVRERLNELLEEQASQQDGPESIDDAMSQIESEAGFDPRETSEMLAFGNMESNAAGSILWTEWDRDAVTSALTENGYSEESYGDTTVYARNSSDTDGTRIALLSDSTYGFGTRESVRTIIDTWNGESASVSGDVETAYTAAQGGYLQFGFDVPTEELPEGQSDQESQINVEALQNIQYGYGSVTNGNNGREMIVNMETDSEDAARGVQGLADLGLAGAKQQLRQMTQSPGADTEDIEEFQTALDNVETSRNGQTVTVKNSDGITFAIGALAVATTFVLGFGTPSMSAT